MNCLAIKDLDLSSTEIKIGCSRDTSRLDRLLSTYRKALSLADAIGSSVEFASSVVSLYDHKGWLTVGWRHPDLAKRYSCILDLAWLDYGEDVVTHCTENGEYISGELI